MNTLSSIRTLSEQMVADAQDIHHYLGSILESMDRVPRKVGTMDHAMLDDCRLLLGRLQTYEYAVRKLLKFSDDLFELDIITERQHDWSYGNTVEDLTSEAQLQKESTRLLLKFLGWCKLAGINSYEGHLL